MIGDTIKQIRKSKNISQKKFAEIIEIPVSTLANYENNYRTPNIDMLNKIATTLNVSIDKILRDSNSINIDSLQSESFDAAYRDYSISNKSELLNHNLKMDSLYNEYFHDLFYWKTREMNPYEFFNYILSISPFTETQLFTNEDIEELSTIFYRMLQLKWAERTYLLETEDQDEFAKLSFLKTDNKSKKYSIHTFYNK